MSKINLLPWREEVRKKQNRLFFFILGSSVILSVFVIMIVGAYFNYRIDVENANVRYIGKEMESVKAEVSEIQILQENKKKLIERINVVQGLESDRTSIVRLLDMVSHTLPQDIYLTILARKEVNNTQALEKQYLVSMEGVAVTNGSISMLLKNLESIKWVSDLKLAEVSISKNGEGLDFKLEFIQGPERE